MLLRNEEDAKRESRRVGCERFAPLRAFHYNGGAIPLRDVLFGAAAPPSGGLKWVFTVTSGSPDEFVEATRVAVMSAQRRTSLTPVCIWSGRPDELYAWLQAHGVRIVQHTPQWVPKLMRGMQRAAALGHHARSPLYTSPVKMLGTWLRIDLATLGFVDDYVLYTDIDVVFEADVCVEDFGRPLPAYFTMGTEANGALCGVGVPPLSSSRFAKVGNAGVMLINIQGMRRTHDALLRWVFSSDNLEKGLYFGPWGPGDQGALSNFYSAKFEVRPWPRFNWKPYWGGSTDNVTKLPGQLHSGRPKIIHFHGPKPIDYLCYLQRYSQPRKSLHLDEHCATVANVSGIREVFETLVSQCGSLPSVCFQHVATYLYWRGLVQEGGQARSSAGARARVMHELVSSSLRQWPMLRRHVEQVASGISR